MDYRDMAAIVNMIEDGILLTARDIETKFHLTTEQVNDAIRAGDISVAAKFAGREYFYVDQVEMYAEYLMEEADGE